MAGATSRISKVLVTGPLAPFAEDYRRELRERGYTERSAVNQLRQAARFSCWLQASQLSVPELSADRVEVFLGWQRAVGRHRSQWSRPGLACLLDVLRELGVLGAGEPARADSPAEVLLAGFGRYLAAERGLAAGTVRGYVGHARRFLEGLPSFLRFCFIERQMPVDLSQAALPVTGRRRSPLPRGITKADAGALLGGCDRRSALGRRDYAMLVTLLRLGLRAGEVARLRLDDIDWRAGELVVRGKGAREDRLPLPAEVGQAIASYLRRGRPASGRREVFLQARAPFGPIAPGTVSSTVRRACRRAGVAEVGAHRLRHTVACEMVAAGVPLADIAQVLRHHSLQTTALYSRVDLDRLRALAAPWPAG